MRVFLTASATNPEQMNVVGLQLLAGGLKRSIVSPSAIGVRARWGVSLMQGQPFLGLLDAIVMKLVVHLPGTQRFQQIVSDLVRKLARVNRDVSGNHAS